MTSKRNRPAESAEDHKVTEQEKAFEAGAGAMLVKQGMDPSEVAEMVVNAIRRNDFWIVTHPEWHEVLEERVAAMKSDNALRQGFGG